MASFAADGPFDELLEEWIENSGADAVDPSVTLCSAEFVVVIAGDIMTGLPRIPSANAIHLNEDGQVEGLF